ncbi:iron(III) transport system permease protein [Pseudochelatococcus contaminans]|uniref:Iron(III) transport system permease protein n=1 Tax=Pseudochelatococcus contaminans TaxID=1538103 RepID=A0A7W5Z4R9_9HYPH|nr:iron(III) transport system permease protein [Pseudochelatococcus contaminans]
MTNRIADIDSTGGLPIGGAGIPRRLPDGAWVIALLAIVVALFAVLPFGRLIWAALAPAGFVDPGPMLAEISRRAAMRATWHSIETGVVSAVAATALGGALAFILTLTDVRARRSLSFCFILSMMIAPQVVALAYFTLAGPSSPLLNALGLAPPPGSNNPLMSREGIMLVLALHHAPLAFVTLRAGLRSLPADMAEAALTAGAKPWRVMRSVVLPLMRPYLAASLALTFVAAVGNFGIPALLGVPVNYLTLPTLIYRRMVSFGPSVIADAAALSLLVALIAGAGVALAAWWLKRAGAGTGGSGSARFSRGRPIGVIWTLRHRLAVEIGVWIVVAVALFLPLVSLLATALVPSYGVPLTWATATLDNFVEVLVRQDVTVRAFRNSFIFAASSALFLALIAVPLAYSLDRQVGRMRGAVEGVIEIPYALPGIVLAIACILLFLKPLPLLGVSIYGTPFIILFAYAARFLPVALKAPAAAVGQLPIELEEAARICGASFFRRLRSIVLPVVAPAATAGGLMVFLFAFNELTVSALLWSSGTETIGVALFSLEEAGFASPAAAIALTAVVAVAAIMAFLDALAPRLPPGILPWRE